MEKLAIMQPYFLPYLGYFQLMASVDEFMPYPHVDFSRKSYVLRNRWEDQGELVWFHLPINKQPVGAKIEELTFHQLDTWQAKWFKSCRTQYGRSPHFEETMALLEDFNWNGQVHVHEFITDSLEKVANHLGVPTELTSGQLASIQEVESEVRRIGIPALRRHQRVKMLLELSGKRAYVNAASGRALYDPEWFRIQNQQIGFMTGNWDNCDRLASAEFQNASILHLLMNFGREQVSLWVSSSSLTFAVDWLDNKWDQAKATRQTV